MNALRNGKALIVDENKKEENDFENNAEIRNRVGFYTKVEKTPEANEHPKLTARFRIMQKISEALLAAGSNSLANPAVKTERESALDEKRPAYITSAEWKGSEANKALSGAIAETADAHELTGTVLVMFTPGAPTSTLVAP